MPQKTFEPDSPGADEAAKFSRKERLTVGSVFTEAHRGCRGQGGAGKPGCGPLKIATESSTLCPLRSGAYSPAPLRLG